MKNNFKRDFVTKNKNLLISNINKSLNYLEILNNNALVMDVVYQPEETLLIKLCKYFDIQTISGKRMNLLQAVLGFKTCFNKLKINNKIIEETMSNIKD